MSRISQALATGVCKMHLVGRKLICTLWVDGLACHAKDALRSFPAVWHQLFQVGALRHLNISCAQEAACGSVQWSAGPF